MLIFETSSWWIYSLSVKCISLSLSINFGLKFILLDIRMAMSVCFLGPFTWKVYPDPLLWDKVCWSLLLKCFCYMKPKNGSWFQIFSTILCLLVGDLSPVTLRKINDQWWRIFVILLLMMMVVIHLVVLVVAVIVVVCVCICVCLYVCAHWYEIIYFLFS
jgi:hypothetical protein